MTEAIGLILDTETTGVDPSTCNVVETGGVIYRPHDNHSVGIFNSQRSNPGVEIPEEAAQVHGITTEDVRYTISDKLSCINLVGQVNAYASLYPDAEIILIGHNSEYYDIPLISRIAEVDLSKSYRQIDTFRLIRRILPNNGHTLVEAYTYFTGNKPIDAHSAVYDCLMTSEVLKGVLKFNQEMTLVEMADFMSKPLVYSTMPFGKHKGKPMEAVPQGYINFCTKNFDRMDIDLKATFDHYG